MTSSAPTPEQREALCNYVRHLSDHMGLRDWHFEIAHDPPNRDDCSAMINVLYGQRNARIWFQHDWPEWDPERLRGTVTHELVHCHLNPLRNVLDNMETAIGQVMHSIAYNALTDRIEYATDAIAYAWARKLPLMVEEEDAEDYSPVVPSAREVLFSE